MEQRRRGISDTKSLGVTAAHGSTRRQVLRRAAVAVGGLALGPTLLQACTTPEASPTSPAPKQGGTLTIGLSTFPGSLSEREQGAPIFTMLLNIGEGLAGQGPDTKVIPGLAESWKLLDDKTWEFKLRAGVKFQNGEPFNSRAVKFTFERALDPANKFARRVRIGQVIGVETPDDLTVRLKTSIPFPLLPYGTSQIPIEPPNYFAQVGEAGYEQKPVGTGPFKLVEWVPGQQVVFDAYQEYWAGRPNVDRLIFKFIPDASTRVAALKAGEVDVINAVPVDLAASVETATTTLSSKNQAAGMTFSFNLLEDGPLLNLKVRQAVDMAIDRKTILQSIYRGYGAVLDGQIADNQAVGYNPNLKPTSYDPDMARRLLTEAGYPNGLTLVVTSPVNFFPGDRDLVLAVTAQLKKVGIETNVNFVESVVLLSALATKKMKDIHLISWSSNGDAENALVWYNDPGTTFWKSPDFASTLQQARSEMNPATRVQLLQQAAVIMNREVPGAMLLQPPLLTGLNKRVTGYTSGWAQFITRLDKVSVR